MPPNILFIISDQHNAKVLGHEGHPEVRTPCLDRLAAEGTRFSNAIVQNPICTPSRTCYLSGQYCHNHGYYGLSGPNPKGLPSIFGHFRRHGYTTAAIGKIHCPEGWVEADADVFHETCKVSVGGRSADYTAFLKAHGKEDKEDHIGLTEFGPAGVQNMDSRPSDLTYEESQEGWITATAIATMRAAQAAGKPFIIQASLPRPHQCTTPSAPFWDWYEGVELTLPPNVDYDQVGAKKAPHVINGARHWRSGNWARFEPKTFEAARQRKLRGYLGAVSQVDHSVGLMLDFLRDNGLADNTIVLYTSDHGDYACEQGLMEKAPGISHDAITRVPSIWRVPGVTRPGAVMSELIESVDVSATFCALAGLPPLETSDGHDLSPLLRGEATPVRVVAVTEFPWSKSLRKGRYRLVYYPREFFPQEYPEGFGELYDLESDPWEMRNRFFDPEMQDVVRELQGDLLNWLIVTSRPKSAHCANSVGQRPPPRNEQEHVAYGVVVNADDKCHPRLIRESGNKTYL